MEYIDGYTRIRNTVDSEKRTLPVVFYMGAVLFFLSHTINYSSITNVLYFIVVYIRIKIM